MSILSIAAKWLFGPIIDLLIPKERPQLKLAYMQATIAQWEPWDEFHDFLPWIDYIKALYDPQDYEIWMSCGVDEATSRYVVQLVFQLRGRGKDGVRRKEVFRLASKPYHPNVAGEDRYDGGPCFAAKKRVELILDRNETCCHLDKPLRLQLEREGKLLPYYTRNYFG